jgi:hypothetical protein
MRIDTVVGVGLKARIPGAFAGQNANLAVERRCAALTELCHALVAAIERAARLDAVHDPLPASFDASRASA